MTDIEEEVKTKEQELQEARVLLKIMQEVQGTLGWKHIVQVSKEQIKVLETKLLNQAISTSFNGKDVDGIQAIAADAMMKGSRQGLLAAISLPEKTCEELKNLIQMLERTVELNSKEMENGGQDDDK